MGSPSHTNNCRSFISCFSLASELKKKKGGGGEGRGKTLFKISRGILKTEFT